MKRGRFFVPGKVAGLLAALCLAVPAAASAAVGDLSQTAGPAACHNELGQGLLSDATTAGQCTVARALRRADDIAISPDGRNVYAASASREAVVVFDRDPATGALTQKAGIAGCLTETGRSIPADPLTAGQCTDIRGLNDGSSVELEISHDGRNVYAGSGTLVIFDRDTTGALSVDPGPAGCLSDSGRSDVFDAGTAGQCTAVPGTSFSDDSVTVGDHLYLAADDGITLFDRGPSGDLTPRGGLTGCIAQQAPPAPCLDGRAVNPEDMELSPDGTHLYIGSQGSFVAVVDRDPATGVLTQAASPAACISVSGESDVGNSSTAGECRVGRGMWRVYGVAVSPNGQSLYSSNVDGDGLGIFDLTPASGEFSQPVGLAGCVSETGQGDESDPATAGQCADGKVLGNPRDVEVSPDSFSVYAAGGRGTTNFDRNPLSGRIQQSPDPSGCLTSDGSSNPLDAATAGQCGIGRAIRGDGLEISPDGRSLYVASADGVGVLRRELAPLCGGRRSTLLGTRAGDTLRGTPRADVISGLGGPDRLIGLGGNDRICGGTGNDEIKGRNGKDRLQGDSGRDRLFGGRAADRLIGGSSRDLLVGGKGRDVLQGGPGRDIQKQ